MKKRNKVMTSLMLDPKQYKKIQRLIDRNYGRTQSEVIRRCIDDIYDILIGHLAKPTIEPEKPKPVHKPWSVVDQLK
jgi:hypothetical protein